MTDLNSWPQEDRPRERLQDVGAAALSDAELIALILGTAPGREGGVIACGRDLLVRFGGLDGLNHATPHELMSIHGVGRARASALAAAIELARRLENRKKPATSRTIRNANDAYQLLRGRMAHLLYEIFVVVALNAQHHPFAVTTVAQGSATYVDVHPREVFAPLIRSGAVSAIIAHNHPSGDLLPSDADLELTDRLVRAGHLLGLPLLDHIIVAATGYHSIMEELGTP